MADLIALLDAFSSGQERHINVFQVLWLFAMSFNELFCGPKLTHLTKVPIY
jgi:hypothetical protein